MSASPVSNNYKPFSQTVVSGWNEQISVLIEDVKRALLGTTTTTCWHNQLSLIDVLERLGIGYLVHEEIEQQLKLLYHYTTSSSSSCPSGHDDIRFVSLHFRLLRQHGYHVTSDVFNKLKNEEGKFKEELKSDMEGMLGLYEAGYLGLPEENILVEAVEFTKTWLHSVAANVELELDQTLAERIKHALNRPLHKGVEKHEQLFFISIYEQDTTHDWSLLRLAKLCFNALQVLYQKELRDLTKWWVDLDLASKLPFARDRLVEVYFWAVGAMWDPKYSAAREFLTKVTMFVSCLDDIYDVKATIQQLELFTQNITRWGTRKMEDLPEYMGEWLEGMIRLVDEIDEMGKKDGKEYCGEYVRLAVINQAKAYLSEARWLGQKLIPTVEEYRRVGVYSCCYPLLSVSILCGVNAEKASNDAFQWLLNDPPILVASSDICRLMDDLVSHEFEQERGHVASSVECYMNEYGVGKGEARIAIMKMVEEDWKEINEELLKPNSNNSSKFSPDKEVMWIFLGLARVMDVLYKESDGYTNSNTSTKDILTALLVTPMIL
ncbi:Probable sesquiterpene synthase [Linum grandiflorum]